MHLVVFLLLTIQVTVIRSDDSGISTSAFCKLCTCSTNNDILCISVDALHGTFNNSEYWFNQKLNASYPIRNIHVHRSRMSTVTVIPASPVKLLDLSHNAIQIILPMSFKNLQSMVELDLSNNELTSELLKPDAFEGLYQPGSYLPLQALKILRLGGNALHTLHQDLFEHSPKLETLDLHGNLFKYIDTQTLIAIGSLAYLKNLDLSYTSLTILPEYIFHTLKNLQTLNLTANELTEVPKPLRDAQNLLFLNLNNNPIENITEKMGFPHMAKLKILHMCKMPLLHTIAEHSMCGLSNLEALYLSDNDRLTHIDGKALSERGDNIEMKTWPPLRKLNIRNNKLSYLDHNLLSNWGELADIDIRDNPWACECENQWLIDSLVTFIDKLNSNHTIGLDCAAPEEMTGTPLIHLANIKYSMRCLDAYGNRPERDASIVIGILVGLLIGIPLVLGLLFCYKKNLLCNCRSGPAAFSRHFYKRPTAEHDDDIY